MTNSRAATVAAAIFAVSTLLAAATPAKGQNEAVPSLRPHQAPPTGRPDPLGGRRNLDPREILEP
jgi:hypothetical protein